MYICAWDASPSMSHQSVAGSAYGFMFYLIERPPLCIFYQVFGEVYPLNSMGPPMADIWEMVRPSLPLFQSYLRLINKLGNSAAPPAIRIVLIPVCVCVFKEEKNRKGNVFVKNQLKRCHPRCSLQYEDPSSGTVSGLAWFRPGFLLLPQKSYTNSIW